MALNIADLFEHAVDAAADLPAIQVDDRKVTLGELEADANRLAHHLAARGIGVGDHVGIYAKNSVEHVVALLAVYKLRGVTINVNYRYVESELDYIFDNADLKALIFERSYADLVAACAPKHEQLTTFVAIPDPTDPDNSGDLSPFGGVTLAEAIEGQSDARDFGERSADDVHIIYTGGTTGWPKGVMWRHEDFWRVLGGGVNFYTGEFLDEYDQSKIAADRNPMVTFPLSPMMHGGAQSAMLMHLFAGHLTILEPKFDPVKTWEIIDREKVQLMFMTGDAMARPLIEAYEAGDFDGSSLFAVASSAAIFSPEVKERWMAALPNAVYTDSIGSTETGFQGTGIEAKGGASAEGVVVSPGVGTVILDENDRPIDLADPANVGKIGRTARSGFAPIGYYKDPEKTAKTMITVDGVRYSVPGDFAKVMEEGKIQLLGRGSNCINTGGEKVYPEEVESELKKHPAVYDTLVVGVPDETYGQAVSAVIQLREGEQATLEEIKEFLRSSLSGYKLPRSAVFVDQIPRHVTGKANYVKAREVITTQGA